LALVFLAFRFISKYLAEIAVSFKFFTVPMISNTITYLCAVISAVLFHSALGVSSVFAGFIAGSIITILLILYLLKKQLKWHFNSKLHFPKNIFKDIFYAKIWHISRIALQFIPILILSGFASGIISSVTYSQQTSDIASYFIISQFALVAGIKLNELSAHKNLPDINKIFSKSVKILCFAVIPITFLMFIYSDEIITIVFKRGAFEKGSVILCGRFLKYFVFLLPSMVIYTLMTKINMAAGKIKQAAIFETITNIVLIAAIIWAINNYGAMGYPLALVTVFALINTLGLYIYNKIVFPWLEFKQVIKYIFMVFAVNAAIAFAVIQIKPFLFENIMLNLLSGSVIFIFIAGLLSFIFNLNEDFNLHLRQFFKKLK
jgi:putative peptidoglycan lipid II flippase